MKRRLDKEALLGRQRKKIETREEVNPLALPQGWLAGTRNGLPTGFGETIDGPRLATTLGNTRGLVLTLTLCDTGTEYVVTTHGNTLLALERRSGEHDCGDIPGIVRVLLHPDEYAVSLSVDGTTLRFELCRTATAFSIAGFSFGFDADDDTEMSSGFLHTYDRPPPRGPPTLRDGDVVITLDVFHRSADFSFFASKEDCCAIADWRIEPNSVAGGEPPQGLPVLPLPVVFPVKDTLSVKTLFGSTASSPPKTERPPVLSN